MRLTSGRVAFLSAASIIIIGTISVLLLIGAVSQLAKPANSEPIRYFCSRSGVKYIETNYGLSVSFDTYGVPVRCK